MRHRRQVAYRLHHAIDYQPKPTIQKLLTASNEFWSESSTWERKDGLWHCVAATGALKQLVGMEPADAKLALLKLGASWKWG